MIAALDPHAIHAAAGNAVREVEVLASTPSTNEVLLARARTGESIHALALLAEQQTAGRGRRGRDWVSPPGGNLYLSLGWRCTDGIPDGFSLAVGIAIAQALREVAGVAAQLKWPNDVQVEGRKLGGVLVEVAGDFGGPLDAVIGIGLNIAMPSEAAGNIAQPWTDLASRCAQPVDRNRLAGVLLARLVRVLERLQRDSFAALRPEWSALDALHGREVRVSGVANELRGIAAGVDEHGALLLRVQGETQLITAGDVTVRDAGAA